MRWTRFFIPTTKDVPKDAVVPSHQLMPRAGAAQPAGVQAASSKRQLPESECKAITVRLSFDGAE